MTRRQRRLLFGSLAAVSLGIAGTFAALGAWLILPYSAVELAALFLAFRMLERRAGDWELLTVDRDKVVLEARRRGETVRHEFNRLWVRLEAPESGTRGYVAMPVLRYSGRDVEFGEHLLPGDRLRVARELKGVLARVR